jgi:excisionase family DNA binding protein
MSATKLAQTVNELDQKTVLQLLAYIQRRRACDDVIQGLLQARLTQLMATPTPRQDDDDALLTAGQVAKVLGVGKPRTYELLRSGAIATVKLGQRQLRIRRRDLTQYVEQAKASCRRVS